MRLNLASANFNQLNLKYEHSRRSARLGRSVTVGQFSRNPKATFLAFHHELNSFGPTGDDPIKRERNGLSSHNRTIKHLSIDGPASVVDEHFFRRLRMRSARSFFENLGSKSGRSYLSIVRCSSDIIRSRKWLRLFRGRLNFEKLEIKDEISLRT